MMFRKYSSDAEKSAWGFPPRKRRSSIPKQSRRKQNMVRICSRTVVRWQQLCY